jgi:ATP sulfurylase
MNYQKLFDYFSKELDIDLLETEMQEICRIVNEIQTGDICPECGSPRILERKDKFQCRMCWNTWEKP